MFPIQNPFFIMFPHFSHSKLDFWGNFCMTSIRWPAPGDWRPAVRPLQAVGLRALAAGQRHGPGRKHMEVGPEDTLRIFAAYVYYGCMYVCMLCMHGCMYVCMHACNVCIYMYLSYFILFRSSSGMHRSITGPYSCRVSEIWSGWGVRSKQLPNGYVSKNRVQSWANP